MKVYSIIESDDHAELVDAVCQAQNEGWDCQGGVCIWFEPDVPPVPPHISPGIVHYAQALVRDL